MYESFYTSSFNLMPMICQFLVWIAMKNVQDLKETSKYSDP